jgi:hypothetical protein
MDDFAPHVPAWRFRELRARLRAARHEGEQGEPCAYEHRALVRRWATGARRRPPASIGRAPGGWKAGAPRGPGTGRRRIATGDRLRVIEQAVAGAFAPRDWLSCELGIGDIVKAYNALRRPMAEISSARPSYRRFLQWFHWRRSIGPVADTHVRVGPVQRHHRQFRELGLRQTGDGYYEGVVEGELMPAFEEFCRKARLQPVLRREPAP